MKNKIVLLVSLLAASAPAALAETNVQRDLAVINAANYIITGDIYGAVESLSQEQAEQIEDQFVVRDILRDLSRVDQLVTLAGSMSSTMVAHKSDICFSVFGPMNALVDNVTESVSDLSEAARMQNSGLITQIEKARAAADYVLAFCLPAAVSEKEFSIKKFVTAADVTKALGSLKAVSSELNSNLNQLLN